MLHHIYANVYERVVEDHELFARIQRTKLKFVIVVGLAAIAAHLFR